MEKCIEEISGKMGWLMKNIQLFQIFYNDETRACVSPPFIPLDNQNSERPDWFEYWPIRNYLLNNPVPGEQYLGFFSPRFTEKTGVSGQSVLSTIETADAQTEVFSFSPYFDQNALHLNSFLQGEHHHSGLVDASQSIIDKLGFDVDILSLVQDQTRIVFSNYFVAKGNFWKKWLEVTNEVYELCEAPGFFEHKKLNEATMHRGVSGYPMKIFVMERMVSIVLETMGTNAAVLADTNNRPLSLKGAAEVFGGLVVLDSLKSQYLKTGSQLFLEHYKFHQGQIFNLLSNVR